MGFYIYNFNVIEIRRLVSKNTVWYGTPRVVGLHRQRYYMLGTTTKLSLPFQVLGL